MSQANCFTNVPSLVNSATAPPAQLGPRYVTIQIVPEVMDAIGRKPRGKLGIDEVARPLKRHSVERNRCRPRYPGSRLSLAA